MIRLEETAEGIALVIPEGVYYPDELGNVITPLSPTMAQFLVGELSKYLLVNTPAVGSTPS